MKLNRAQQVRAGNYSSTFNVNPSGREVLKDLQELFGGSCFDENPYKMAYKEGSRDVLLYIQERLNEYVQTEDS